MIVLDGIIILDTHKNTSQNQQSGKSEASSGKYCVWGDEKKIMTIKADIQALGGNHNPVSFMVMFGVVLSIKITGLGDFFLDEDDNSMVS